MLPSQCTSDEHDVYHVSYSLLCLQAALYILLLEAICTCFLVILMQLGAMLRRKKRWRVQRLTILRGVHQISYSTVIFSI